MSETDQVMIILANLGDELRDAVDRAQTAILNLPGRRPLFADKPPKEWGCYCGDDSPEHFRGETGHRADNGYSVKLESE